MKINLNQTLEDAILGKIIFVLLEQSFRVEISDQDGGGLFVYAYPDNGQSPPEGAEYWISLVPGNGVDFVSDFSVNLEQTLKPVNDFIEMFDND